MKVRKSYISLVLFVASFASIGFSSNKQLKQNYERAAEKRWVLEQASAYERFKSVELRAKKYRQEVMKEASGVYSQELKEIKKALRELHSSRLTSKQKSTKAKQIVQDYQYVYKNLATSFRHLALPFQNEMRPYLRGLICRYDAFFNVFCADRAAEESPMGEEQIFTAPFGDEEEFMTALLLGFGQADANRYSGFVKTEATAVDAGSHYAKAGVLEVLDVPAGVARVKITTTLNSQHSLLAFAIVGVTGGESKGYLDVYGDNQFVCTKTSLLGWVMAPVLFYAANSGDLTRTLTCEFTPAADGGEYVVASGTLSSVFAALPAATIAETDGEITEIKVEFLED